MGVAPARPGWTAQSSPAGLPWWNAHSTHSTHNVMTDRRSFSADGERRRHRTTDITTRCPGSRVRIDPET